MSIPHEKQSSARKFIAEHRHRLRPINHETAKAPRGPIVAVVVMGLLGALLITPSAQAETFLEGFEGFAVGTQDPSSTFYANTCTGGDTTVVSAPVLNGQRSLRFTGKDCGLDGVGLASESGNSVAFNVGGCSATQGCGIGWFGDATSGSFDGCGDANGGTGDLIFCLFLRTTQAPVFYYYIDTVRFSGTWTSTPDMLLLDTWSSVSLGVTYRDPVDGGFGTFAILEYCQAASCWTATLETVSYPDEVPAGPSDASIFSTFEGSSGSASPEIYVDDYTYSVVEFVEITVTGLTGYSMDATGRHIIARTDGGEMVRTYGANDLIETASEATTDCAGRQGGVLSTTLNNKIYSTFIDCDGSGDTNIIKIRSASLGDPPFEESCSEAQATIDDGDFVFDFPLPTDVGYLGTLIDSAIDYRRCTQEGTAHAAAAITFSDTGLGTIGIFAWIFNNAGNNNNGFAEAQLDTSAFPIINSLCSYRSSIPDDPTSNPLPDFIAGATQNGPTGIYIGTVDISGFGAEGVDPDLDQVFLNNGVYGGATGLACGDRSFFIQQNLRIVAIDIAANRTISQEWETPASGSPNGVAATGDSNFMAYLNNDQIIVAYAANGTITGTYEKPPGTWVGMEFDFQGEKLATFTTTRIRVYTTSESTCELQVDCGTAGPGGDDLVPPSVTPSPNGGGGGGFANAPAWLYPTIATFIIALIIGAVIGLITGRGYAIVLSIMAFLATIMSVFVWEMPWYIPLLLLVLPALAVVIIRWVK